MKLSYKDRYQAYNNKIADEAIKNGTFGSSFNRDRMRVLKAFHTIKLDGLLNHNQIHVEPEDYDVVLEYISKRIPKSKSDN